jgi:hypothetical protein
MVACIAQPILVCTPIPSFNRCSPHVIQSRTSHTVRPLPMIRSNNSHNNSQISPRYHRTSSGLSPERFALHLGTYLVSKYAHIHRAFVSLEKLRWSHITLSGNVDPHSHSFVRDGNDKQTVEVEVRISILFPSHASRIQVEC